jgi:hypothetical protein
VQEASLCIQGRRPSSMPSTARSPG